MTTHAAEPPSFTVDFDGAPAPAELVRCHFDEGRIVIRINERLHVLHDGDRLEDTGLSVLDMASASATLTIREGGAEGHLRIVRITEADDGELQLRELSTDPNSLQPGSQPPSTPMGNRRIPPPEPDPSDS
jgi:hypothetical protein